MIPYWRDANLPRGIAAVDCWVVLDRGPPPRKGHYRYCIASVAVTETPERVALENEAVLVEAPRMTSMDEACELQQRMQALAETHEG